MHKAILLMFLLVADVCIAEDEWTYITTGDHNVSFYINTSTLRVDSSKRKIWIMSDFEKGNITNPQMLSIKRQDEFDCKEEKYRSIYAVFQLFPLIHRHKENKAIQRSLKISFRELLTKLQYYGSIN